MPDSLNYDGASVSVLSWGGQENITFPKEAGDGSDPVQSELYYHYRAIESRFGIQFDTSYVSSAAPDRDKFMTVARAEDASFDLIQTQSLFPTTLAQEGRIANLMDLDYPDLSMPWWGESTSEWSQYGGLYFISSNSSAGAISNLTVIFTNIQMMEEEGLGDPVKLVLRGSWTLDAMMEYSKRFAGLAEANPGEIYGIVVDDYSRMDPLYYGFGFNSTRNNANGVAELAYDNPETLEQISNAVDKLVTLFTGVETEIHQTDDPTELYNGTTAMFLGFMQYIRNIEDPEAYAVIPVPKLDAKQKNYRTVYRDYVDAWCVPISAVDKDLCGKLIEAFGSSEYRNIAPFYYEQYLKRRYASDAEGMRVFDLLRQSVIYDFGRVSQLAGIGAENIWRPNFWNGGKVVRNVLMSSYEESIKTLRSNLEEVLKNYREYAAQ